MEEYLLDNEETEEDGMYEHYRLTVEPGQSMMRIDKFLSNRIENASRSRIQAAADAGNILVNEVPVKASYKVKPNDEIRIVLDFPRREFKIIPEEIPLNIIFEDDQLIVLNKPAGMVVHPGHGNYSGTLVNALAWYLKDLPLFQGEDFRPGLIHRIDKDTSGLLVVAKTLRAKNNLALQFYEKRSDRRYQALVWGIPNENAGTITGNIGRNPKNRQQFTVFPDGSDTGMGKPAITHFTVLKPLGYVSLIECRLETGRTHQIRVHMKFINHPLFNDSTYGGDQILRGTTYAKYRQFVQNCFKMLPRQALHAKTLGFNHPVTGEKMLFDSDLPEDMDSVIKRWENYIANRNE
jgi:23S rRNA pseudouridine1911/1915/1917 synthase